VHGQLLRTFARILRVVMRAGILRLKGAGGTAAQFRMA
jgi:hypothetical protein